MSDFGTRETSAGGNRAHLRRRVIHDHAPQAAAPVHVDVQDFEGQVARGQVAQHHMAAQPV